MKHINESEIEKIVKELTLEEKITMIHGGGLFRTNGVERLSIPPIFMSDGPMGVRKEFRNDEWKSAGETDDYVTYLPSNTALASTWNRELARSAGHVLGIEARGRGKDVILAPGINIQRSPLCGRNFEYMSEDPKLIEEMVVPLIEGIQDNTDVAACVKHFAANAQETERLWVDTHVSERALREIYYPGFKAAVQKAGSYTLMGAYNMLEGEHCCQSKHLLNGVLRGEWEYDGTVISDWGGVHDTKASAESGLDIEMSVTNNFDAYFMADPLLELVKKGEIAEELIDTKVSNILRLMFRLNMLGEEKEKRCSGTYNLPGHREVVLETAREAIVLLKNEEDRLPLKKDIKKLAVIGQNAMLIHSSGGGSAEIKALYEISPLMGLKKTLGGNVEISYAKGYYIPHKFTDRDLRDINWQETSLNTPAELKVIEKMLKAKEEGDLSEEGIFSDEIAAKQQKYLNEAISLAKESDEVIFIGGLDHEYDIEGRDRTSMDLPYDQDVLIERLLEVNPNTIIVIMAGAPVTMNFSQKAKAIVWYSYAGMEGGTALAEVLTGAINPSGKLPMTMPKKLEDAPAHKFGEFAEKKDVTFKEDIYVGYRYFESFHVEPMFCFGHGLSYSRFEYGEPEFEIEEEVGIDISDKIFTAEDKISPFEVRVNVSVKNNSAIDGAETVQVYVSDLEASMERPALELKGFQKVYLKAGEERQVYIRLSHEAFGFYKIEKKCFEAEVGAYEIFIGASVRDLRHSAIIELEKGYCYR